MVPFPIFRGHFPTIALSTSGCMVKTGYCFPKNLISIPTLHRLSPANDMHLLTNIYAFSHSCFGTVPIVGPLFGPLTPLHLQGIADSFHLSSQNYNALRRLRPVFIVAISRNPVFSPPKNPYATDSDHVFSIFPN